LINKIRAAHGSRAYGRLGTYEEREHPNAADKRSAGGDAVPNIIMRKIVQPTIHVAVSLLFLFLPVSAGTEQYQPFIAGQYNPGDFKILEIGN
jgi:hypothetical protein